MKTTPMAKPERPTTITKQPTPQSPSFGSSGLCSEPPLPLMGGFLGVSLLLPESLVMCLLLQVVLMACPRYIMVLVLLPLPRDPEEFREHLEPSRPRDEHFPRERRPSSE